MGDGKVPVTTILDYVRELYTYKAKYQEHNNDMIRMS